MIANELGMIWFGVWPEGEYQYFLGNSIQRFVSYDTSN